MKTETIEGTIQRVFFTGNGFMAGILANEAGGTSTFAGAVMAVKGDRVSLTGQWTHHPKYQLQFKVESASVKMDTTPSGVAKMLAADSRFEGIGEKRAEAIVHAALELSSDGEVLTGLRESPVEVAALAKVPVKVIEHAYTVWKENADRYAATSALLEQGWTTGQAARIMEVYGDGAANIVRQDPYVLINKIERFGFRTVDAIATGGLGIHSADPRRLTAGIMFALDAEANDGNTWIQRSGLIGRTFRELEPDSLEGEAQIEQMLNELIASDRISSIKHPNGEEILADTRLLEAEQFVIDFLREGLQRSMEPLRLDGARARQSVETLNDGQREIVEMFSTRRVVVMSGGAGTGKTYTTRVICDVAQDSRLAVGLCAPTGKAARRLASLTDRRAMTIHKMLEPKMTNAGFAFTRGTENPLEYGMVIVDEFSMVDVRLLAALIRAMPEGCRLVLVGDHHQIPSIGPGAVLRDLISARSQPGIGPSINVLTQTHRQAGELARNTQAILDGVVVHQESPAWGIVQTEKGDEEGAVRQICDVVETLVTDPEVAAFFGRPVSLDFDVQVLSPTRKHNLGTYALNARLQRLRARLQGLPCPEQVEPGRPPKPAVGDRVIWTQNDYELDLMNGTLAIVKALPKGGSMIIETEYGDVKEIEPGKRTHVEVAYALTYHKVQGSEFPFVVLVVSSKHWRQRDRNLFYTGASRASKSLTIVGDAVGMRAFAQEKKSDSRQTFGQLMMRADGWHPSSARMHVDSRA